jgi:hypothetical protein
LRSLLQLSFSAITCTKATSQLSAARALRSVQKQPQRVRNYFLHKNVTYAAA